MKAAINSKNENNKTSKEGSHVPEPENPDTKLPVSPDEDNDFTIPEKPIIEPENPFQAPPIIPNTPQRIPGPDEPPVSIEPTNSDIDPVPNSSNQPETLKSGRNNSTLYILLIFLFLSFQTIATTPIKEPSAVKTENPAATLMIKRLEEIKALDKSDLKQEEKKALRKEVREIKKKMAELSGGVYLSAGAIIIIIILLIILV